GAVVLMPLPHVALERRLGVDLELVDVDALAEQLLKRIDQARMVGEQPKYFAVGVRGESGARRAGLLAPDFLPPGLEDRLGLGARPGEERRQPQRRQYGLFVGGKSVIPAVRRQERNGRRKHHHVVVEAVGGREERGERKAGGLARERSIAAPQPDYRTGRRRR